MPNFDAEDIRNLGAEFDRIFREAGERGAKLTPEAQRANTDLVKALQDLPKNLSKTMSAGAADFAKRVAQSASLATQAPEGTGKERWRFIAAQTEDYFEKLQQAAREELSIAQLKALQLDITRDLASATDKNVGFSASQRAQYEKTLGIAQRMTEEAMKRAKLSEMEEILGKRINRNLFQRNALIAAAVGLLDRTIISFANLRQQTGATIGQTLGLARVAGAGAREALGRGIILSPREAAETVAALAQHTETLSQVTGMAVANAAELQQRFGLSADEAARLVGHLQVTPGYTGEMTAHMIKFADNLAQAMDLSPAKVMQEMARNASIFAQHGASAAESLTRAAAEAVRMGTSLEAVEGFADRLVGDIDGTIEGFMRLRTLGIDIGDPLSLMQLAEAGDTGELGRQLAQRLEAQGMELSIQSLGRVRARALEGVLGFSIDELARMAKGVDDLATNAELAAAQTDENRSAGDKLGEATLNLTQRTNEAVAALAAFSVSLYASAGGAILGRGSGLRMTGNLPPEVTQAAGGWFHGPRAPGIGGALRGAGIGAGVGMAAGMIPGVNRGWSAAGGTIGGLAGSILGPGGAILGSVIGTAAGVGIGEVIEYWEKKKQEDDQKRRDASHREMNENTRAIIEAMNKTNVQLVSRHGRIVAETTHADSPRQRASNTAVARIET